jgi:hypothetical protein
MSQTCEGPPRGGGCADGPEVVCLSANASDTAPNSAPNQAEIMRNSRAVREATIASILDESHWLLGDLTVHASIAQQYAELGDARGFLYSLDRVVEQAIRAGAEGIELRRIRKEMREARR